MFLDGNGLPVQQDGDANDQLQRCAMIVAGVYLDKSDFARNVKVTGLVLPGRCVNALEKELQPRPGIYNRYPGGDERNVSGDQLISALAAWIALRDFAQAGWLTLRILLRGGFAQNTRDMYGRTDWKLPDYIFIRSLPLMCRVHWALYPLALVFDVLLVLSALAVALPVWRDDKGFTKRTPDDVDQNVSVMTFAVCRAVMPTPFSMLASKLFSKLMPWNYGCMKPDTSMGLQNVYFENFYPPVYGALRWYHRAESGGNPEIAELWRPIVEKYLV